MPADVIDMWLLTFFNRFGWPPKKDNEWRFVLGQDNDLSFWERLSWQQQELKISPERIDTKSREIIIDLFRTHVLGDITVYSGMSDGSQRFKSCCKYIRSDLTFPRPVVLMQSANGYHVLDGYHRLAAFFYLYGWFKIENDEISIHALSDIQPAWIASLA